MRHEQDAPEPELTQLERELGALTPAPGRFDRDLVMYRAGLIKNQRSYLFSHFPWISAAACLGLVALGEAVLLTKRPATKIIEHVVFVHNPSPVPSVEVVEKEPIHSPPSDTPESGQPMLDRTDLYISRHTQLLSQIARVGLDAIPPAAVVGVSGENPVGPSSIPRLLQNGQQLLLESGGPT